MLSVKTTDNLTGVTVSGTYWDLNALYDALSNVIGEEGSYPEFEACRIRVLGLCYDIRHAYQGDRNRGKIEYGDEVFSFEYLWPEMVFIYGVYYNQICRRADAVIMISVWGRNGKNTVFADKRGLPC